MDKKTFETLDLVSDGFEKVESYILSKPELVQIVNKTESFLDGFYSEFALELLSTVDYISLNKETFDLEIIKSELESWSERKRTLFSNDRFLNISINHLRQHLG